MDKKIAEKWLNACNEYENSWNGEKYLKTRWDVLFKDSLIEEEQKSGLAQCLLRFGWRYWNDCIDICNNILEN